MIYGLLWTADYKLWTMNYFYVLWQYICLFGALLIFCSCPSVLWCRGTLLLVFDMIMHSCPLHDIIARFVWLLFDLCISFVCFSLCSVYTFKCARFLSFDSFNWYISDEFTWVTYKLFCSLKSRFTYFM